MRVFTCKNFFQPLPISEMIQDKKLTRKTVVKLLNEIFTLDKKGNENRIENFASENNIHVCM